MRITRTHGQGVNKIHFSWRKGHLTFVHGFRSGVLHDGQQERPLDSADVWPDHEDIEESDDGDDGQRRGSKAKMGYRESDGR